MHCKTRENWPFSGLFSDFRVILTSGGFLLKITRKDSQGEGSEKRSETCPNNFKALSRRVKFLTCTFLKVFSPPRSKNKKVVCSLRGSEGVATLKRYVFLGKKRAVS